MKMLLGSILAIIVVLPAGCEGDAVGDGQRNTAPVGVAGTRQSTQDPEGAPSFEVGQRIITTGDDRFDEALLTFTGGSLDQLGELVGLKPWPCDPAGLSGPPCGSAAPGVPVLAFLLGQQTTGDSPYTTDLVQAAAHVRQIVDRHASWMVFAIAQATEDDPEGTRYVVWYRVGTGNSGVLWYFDSEGRIIGSGGGGVFDSDPLPGVEYICGPSYGPSCYESRN